MSFEPQDRERSRRIEGKQDALLRQVAAAERRWEESEAKRVQEWEEREGRQMTRLERLEASSDGLLRKIDFMTVEMVAIVRAVGDDMRREFAESRADARAGREALLAILDRLPPPREAG
jgi:hypothetical protein